MPGVVMRLRDFLISQEGQGMEAGRADNNKNAMLSARYRE